MARKRAKRLLFAALPKNAAGVEEHAVQRSHHPDGTEIADFYVRAIRTGPFVFVAGTTSLDASGAVQGADAAAQTRVTLQKIDRALQSAGAGMADLVRLTIYVTDVADGPAVVEEIARAVVRPIVSTLVAVTALARPGLVVEIEATAVIADGGPPALTRP